ncbi:hypothetical protein ASPACDRAFT_61206 [Aspergillus aculeatus ATCC 16872]|uniref:Coenzyme Q-binding protein COQ10 START domain-containing protein n=1 Tax=Aspergillus aculeatus (strain ATCC 16872 / CBS 172.66 / WB 5094) TaxID=690307 RepID=A0A1L9WTB7_ASPA1|nr:uncharacterized protein ASPACDRAFT_61206 [Aspergillus aculeatus ATCC 16872]OJJ99431.1 hypothetical protein ASPACDRAFT_61206 [Aspergillus aculeatus ATCC 16872]
MPSSSSSSSSPVLHLTSSIQIHAPLDAVWSALTDTTTWAKWNRFVPGVTIRAQPPSPLDDHTTPATTTTPAPETETTPPTTTQPSQTQTPPPPAAAGGGGGALQKGTRMTFHVNMHPSAASTAPQSFRSVDNHVGLVVTEFLPPSPASHPDSHGDGDGDGSPRPTSTATATSTATPTATRRARITWANDTAFQGRVMAALLSAERVHELVEREVVDASSGSVRVVTEVTNWEVQEGYLAYVVKWMFERRLEENFRCWVEDLKGFVEQQL